MRGTFQDFIYENKRKLIIVGGVILFLIICVSGYFIIRNILYSVTLNITVSPSVATVKVGNDKYGPLGTHKIRPGEYEVEVFADGFETETGKLVAVADETVEISLVLEPTADNSGWYDEHPWDATAAGDIRADAVTQEYYDLQSKNEILKYVPYYNYNYTIDYENNCAENGGGVCLVIDADFGFRRYALQYLQSTGVDLSPYYIKIKGSSLPFGRIDLNVPDGLIFDGDTSGAMIGNEELTIIDGLVNGYISSTFNLEGYSARILQTKKYDEQYYGMTIAVYEGDGSLEYDLYRMIVGKVGDEYMIFTNADLVLSQYNNPNVPRELLRVFNSY